MDKMNRHTGWQRLGSTNSLKLFGLLLCSLVSLPGFSQTNYTVPYSFPDDIKQYSTVMVPICCTANNEETVMVGTIFHTQASGLGNTIHFLRMDGTGIINVSEEITDPDYLDTRVVSVVANTEIGADYYYITCLVRFNQPPSPNPTDRDAIKIVKVDGTGTVVDEVVIENTTSGTGSSGSSIYPVHSIMIGSNLYICGYVTSEYTTAPNEPNFNTNKEAFVLSMPWGFPMAANTPNIVTMDWTQAGATYDYDIAMRMKEIKHPSSTNLGKILVTGSCNGYQTWNPPYTFHRSATLNITVDPTTLTPGTDNSFMHRGQPEHTTEDEYGIDFYEDLFIAHDKSFIVSNIFLNTDHGSTFDLTPYRFDVTLVDYSTLMYDNTRSMYLQGNRMWATQFLDTKSNTAKGINQTGTPISNFIIAGVSAQYSNCTPPADFATANYNVFLLDVSADWSAASNYKCESDLMHVYTMNTTYGTSNNPLYANLGSGLSFIYWNSMTAARRGIANNDHVVLNAPKQTAGLLGLKWVNPRFDNYRTDCGHDVNCLPSFWDDNNIAAGISMNTSSVALSKRSRTLTNTPYSSPIGYLCLDANAGDDWKPSGIKGLVHKTGKTSIYPNPAVDEIQIALADDISADADIRIELTSITGQSMGNIYSGKASGLSSVKHLKLPAVVKGLCMVTVYANNQISCTQKLTIE